MCNHPEKCREWLYIALVEELLPSYEALVADSRLKVMEQEIWFEPFLKRVYDMQNKPTFTIYTNPFLSTPN